MRSITQSKITLISTVTASLVFVTGCTTVQTAANTDEVSSANTNTANTNVVVNTNENTNATVVDENTNAEQGGDVDTSDWQTYTNDEYGFTVRYPSNWFYFNKIDGDQAIYDATLDQSHIRFTSNKNKISVNEFVDITITVSESADDIYDLQYVKHNNKYYIFNGGTWVTDESLGILNNMVESIQFNS